MRIANPQVRETNVLHNDEDYTVVFVPRSQLHRFIEYQTPNSGMSSTVPVSRVVVPLASAPIPPPRAPIPPTRAVTHPSVQRKRPITPKKQLAEKKAKLEIHPSNYTDVSWLHGRLQDGNQRIRQRKLFLANVRKLSCWKDSNRRVSFSTVLQLFFDEILGGKQYGTKWDDQYLDLCKNAKLEHEHINGRPHMVRPFPV